ERRGGARAGGWGEGEGKGRVAGWLGEPRTPAYWQGAVGGWLVPRLVTISTIVSPSTCSPKTLRRSFRSDDASGSRFSFALTKQGTRKKRFNAASASMPKKKHSLTINSCPYGVVVSLSTDPTRNHALIRPDPIMVA